MKNLIGAIMLFFSVACYSHPLLYGETQASDSVYVQVQDADQTLYIDDYEFLFTDVHKTKNTTTYTVRGFKEGVFTISMIHIQGREYFLYCDRWCWGKFIYKL